MDTNLVICLELTYEYKCRTYITYADYCSSNGNISLFSIVGEPQFIMTVEKAREEAGFPFRCVLVGIRDLGFRDDNFNILGRWTASLNRPFVYIC